MTQRKENFDSELYIFSSLEKYSLRQKILIRLADYFIYFIILLLGKTVRFEKIEGWKDFDVEGYENFEEVFNNEVLGIHAFWHDRIFLMTYFWQKYDAVILSSQSFDGEYIARVAQRFGYGVIRGSSTRGGSRALKKMVRFAKKGMRMTFTVDGPRGPRYRVKSGVIHLAKQTGLPIAPMLAEAKNFWTINSWDRLQIPKPFTRAKIFFGEPVFVSTEADHEELLEKQRELKQKLDELVVRGKQWRNDKK